MIFRDVIDESTIHSIVAELEGMAKESPIVAHGAIYILKNELVPAAADAPKRRLTFNRTYVLPHRTIRRLTSAARNKNLFATLMALAREGWLWLAGRDSEIFRDRCDRCFSRTLAPDVIAELDSMADVVLNTVNEAIINYAEHSFDKHALRRRIHVRIFQTDNDLVYVIVRPSGTRFQPFDPLSLTTRPQGTSHLKKRGWGHTLIMERALFLSFDRTPQHRGMLIILRPEEESPSP